MYQNNLAQEQTPAIVFPVEQVLLYKPFCNIHVVYSEEENPAERSQDLFQFNRALWANQLIFPDWYVRLEEELRALIFPVVRPDPDLKRFRHQVYELVEELLESGMLPLAQAGPDMDAERKPVDTIVIHHTTEEPDIRLGKLSAIGLVRQYAFQYLADNVLGRSVRGQPIWSGHFRQGKMVFFAYHWLVRPDGSSERLLADSYIGWHAGNWDINTRSIGLAFSGDYEESAPPIAQIAAAARLIRTHYPQVSKERIFGHSEIVAGTTCPGSRFLHAWRQTLLEEI